MNGRQLLGLVSALVIGVPAFAAADSYLYNDGGLSATGVVAIQQHTVFVEIIKEETAQEKQLHQFAAIVALVKRCVKRERQFDNAVLWFNDQFLFGDKVRETANITEGPVLGEQPPEEMNDQRLNPTWDTDGSAQVIRRSGSPQDGASAGVAARYAGCFIPQGFLHAIGSDDPYTLGEIERDIEDVTGTNVGLVKQLIDMDNSATCDGCIFTYTGSFYLTDPNGYNWLIDKYVYPAVLTGALTKAELAGDCTGGGSTTLAEDVHASTKPGVAVGCDAETHRHTAEDDGGADGDNHCYENPDTEVECDADRSDPTDTPRRESTKVTTMEPMYTVHLQVNATAGQGIRDEALWAWSTGDTRKGAPRWEDDASGACGPGTDDVRCAIEYNALLVVDFEAFDDLNAVLGGEDEITRSAVIHGDGAPNGDDESKAGNSHPHNPEEGPCVEDPDGGPSCPDRPNEHTHDTVTLDLFFVTHRDADCTSLRTDCGAPRFTVEHGGFRDGFGGVASSGRPPKAVDRDCQISDGTHGEGSGPLTARTFIVCDVDTDAGEYHNHDGSETITATG